nr:MAG: ORF1 [Torque teno midi virus]
MPFWWQRRKKFWRGRRRPWYRKRYQTYRRKRTIRRGKRRRPTRRRYRRRKKVRRKFKKLRLTQWQPKFITKCAIRGLHLYLLGAEGKQMSCYTDEQYSWTPSKTPGGGGFTVEQYTLQWLYSEFKENHNYWTRSNATKDLCRFTGGKFIFYKHHKTDFIIYYNRRPTSKPDKYQYCNSHPHELLLRKRTRVLHRNTIEPQKRQYLKIKFKPPRTMQNNWYIQSDFSEQPLIELTIAAADLVNSYISKTDTNQLLTLSALSLQMYTKPDWGQPTAVETQGYKPNPNQTTHLTAEYADGKTQDLTNKIKDNSYAASIAYDTGWFQSAVLKAVRFKDQAVFPIWLVRYNPKIDDGHGNMIYVKHVTQKTYDPPTTDKDVVLENKPLWQLLFGYISYLQKIKAHEDILETYVLLIYSPAILPFKPKQPHLILDTNFIYGKGPYDADLTAQNKKLWFPKLLHQQQSINTIVECGPFIPKYNRDRESSWDLHGKYSFYFKWGGEDTDYQSALDPSRQTGFAITNNLAESIQICDPSKQIPSSLVHAWDYRRGILTKKALKRISENISTDETLSTDSETYKKKKKLSNSIPFYNKETQEIKECLQTLYKENTFQEPQNQEELINLIQQQQEQQQQIKHNLLYLIEDLKKQQTKIKMKTGLLH